MIFKSAYLLICNDCHAHGSIIFGDGTESEVFWSREDLLELITKARKQNEIDAFEEKHLLEAASKLQLHPISSLAKAIVSISALHEEIEGSMATRDLTLVSTDWLGRSRN